MTESLNLMDQEQFGFLEASKSESLHLGKLGQIKMQEKAEEAESRCFDYSIFEGLNLDLAFLGRLHYKFDIFDFS